MTPFDVLSHMFGALGWYVEDEQINALLAAMPEDAALIPNWSEMTRDLQLVGASAERERIEMEIVKRHDTTGSHLMYAQHLCPWCSTMLHIIEDTV
jgi:hypothetical protein